MNDAVTLVRHAIHDPAEARHFMRIVEPGHEVTAVVGEVEVARSRRTRKVKEVGLDIYDPVVYFPRDDVDMTRLVPSSKTTHCPLKGDTAYFHLEIGSRRIENAAWSYVRTIEDAVALKDRIAFDARLVQVTEYTAAGPPAPPPVREAGSLTTP